MSAIDSLTHAHVGKFFNLPIYWVFEEGKLGSLTDWDEDYKKTINKYYLSIGGGSGEHPALIINNDAVILNLLGEMVDVNTVLPGGYDFRTIAIAKQIEDRYFESEDNYIKDIYAWNLDQNQWPLETFVKFSEKFGNKDSISLADKIQHAIALFIIYEMPIEYCLKDSQLIEVAKMIRSNQWEKLFNENVLSCFDAISGILECQKAGKIIRDGKVVWGYSLNDWRRDNQV